MSQVRRGTLLSFDSSAWTAFVLLEGADQEVQLPVGQWVPTVQLAAGVEVAVLLFDATNTDDGVVLGAYGAAGSLSSADTPTFNALIINQPASAASVPNHALIITPGQHTALAASTEWIPVIPLLGGGTYTWAAGALATQRFVAIGQPTVAFAGASTLSDAATLAISGAPAAGTNATLTRSMALWVLGGWTRLAGGLTVGSGTTAPATGVIDMSSALQKSGTQVVAARQTGWTAPTATLSRTAVTNADTLAQTISHLAALITDLTTHGLIGP